MNARMCTRKCNSLASEHWFAAKAGHLPFLVLPYGRVQQSLVILVRGHSTSRRRPPMNAHVDPHNLMQQVDVEVHGVTAATIWRLRMAYLILQSAASVITAFKERTGCSPEKVKRLEEGSMPLDGVLNAMMAYTTALPHWLDLYMAGLDAQNAYDRLFNAVATATSKEFAMKAARARSLIPPPSEPLPKPRHEIFARRLAEGASTTAAYASAFGRKRDNAAAANGYVLVRKHHIRQRAMALEAENALRTLPTFTTILKGFEKRTLRQIEEATLQNVFHAADRYAAFVKKMNEAITPPPGLKCYVAGEIERLNP